MKQSFLRFGFAMMMVAAVFSSCKSDRSDTEIQADVSNKLAGSDDGRGIIASVSNGVVTLTGECKDDECRKDCAEEVREVKGVKEVVNNIQIASVAAPAEPVQIDADNTITSSVNDVVKKYNKVQAEVKDGVVTLRGEITRSQLPELLQEINALKVKRIDNQLVIK